MQTDPLKSSAENRGWIKARLLLLCGLVLLASMLVLTDQWMRHRDPWTSTTYQCTTCGISRHGTDRGLPEMLGWAGQLDSESTITRLLSEEYQERCTFHAWTFVSQERRHLFGEDGHPQRVNPGTFASPEYLRKAIKAHAPEMRCVFRLLLDPGTRTKYELSAFVGKTFFPVFPEWRPDQTDPPPVDQESHWPPADRFPSDVQAWVERRGAIWAELMSR